MQKELIPYNLLIVDMQEDYPAAYHKKTLKRVIKEVRKAKACRAGIILLEMKGAGKTLPEIHKALSGYHKVQFKKKGDPSGASEVFEAVTNNPFLHKTKFKVCGVYTDICVTDTVNDMSIFEDISIEVIAEGCHTENFIEEDDSEVFVQNSFDGIDNRENVIVLWD
jgi:nicotinamidase-related amidase